MRNYSIKNALVLNINIDGQDYGTYISIERIKNGEVDYDDIIESIDVTLKKLGIIPFKDKEEKEEFDKFVKL